VNGQVFNKSDPSGYIMIDCTCSKYSPRDQGGGPLNYVVTVDCKDLATSCCSKACYPNQFTGEWRNPDADEDSIGGEEAVLDAVETSLCVSFIVIDIATVPSGEGPAACLATKTTFKVVRRCFKGFRRITKKPQGLSCQAHFTACLASQIAAGSGPVYGATQCKFCLDECNRRKGVWPWRYINPLTRQFIKCNWWSNVHQTRT
jgi:hypothetical protein